MSGLMTQGTRRPDSHGQAVPIPPSLMNVVQNVISVAWSRLLEEVKLGDFSICEATEDQITERLYMILGELDAAGDGSFPGLSELQSPVREGNVRNYDGKHLDKQPDLAFRPVRGLMPCKNTVPVGIFIECKPIDARHPIPSTYCQAGLIRFVNGDYAWGVDRAMMVGYVRNLCILPDGLSTVLDDSKLRHELALIGTLTKQPNTTLGQAVCQSAHDRLFHFPDIDAPVGRIFIDHLWLHPSEPCEQTRCRVVSAR